MNIDDILGFGFLYTFVTFVVCAIVFGIFESEGTKQNYTMAVLWPLTAILLLPVLIVKLCAVTFKKRGLVSAYAGGIAKVYKEAVK